MHSGWIMRAMFVFATCALLATTARAQPDAGLQAGHAGAEGRDRRPVAAHFDQTELQQAMALGDGSLRGVMGVSNAEGVGGLLNRLIRGREVALAEHEWVLLLPMTAHVRDWYERNNEDAAPHPGGGHVVRLHRDAWKYAGRSRTDADGNFAFDGLAPGRYLLLSNFIVPFKGHRVRRTGEYSVEYSYSAMAGVGTYTVRPVTRVERFPNSMGVSLAEIVEVREGAVTTFSPPAKALY